jgi:lysozyme
MAALLPSKNLPWPIDWEGVALIAQSEGCRLRAYRDVAGVWTLGWGETLGIVEGMTWTQNEADRRLCERLTEFASGVCGHLTTPVTTSEFAALVSLAYNIGLAAFARSSVLKAHNRGDRAGAARAFTLWNRAGGKVIQGLVTRRAREAALYLSEPPRSLRSLPPEGAAPSLGRPGGGRDEPPRSLRSLPPEGAAPSLGRPGGGRKGGKRITSGCGNSPDADPVRPLTRSPTSQAGAVSVATGALALASEHSSQVNELVWSLSLRPLVVVAVVAIAVGAVVLWRRWKQRREGVA